MNKQFQRGVIGTVVAVGALVVLSVSIFVSSVFLKNQKQTISSRAAFICAEAGFTNVTQCCTTAEKIIGNLRCQKVWVPAPTKDSTGVERRFCDNNPPLDARDVCAPAVTGGEDSSYYHCSAFEQVVEQGQQKNCNISWQTNAVSCQTATVAKTMFDQQATYQYAVIGFQRNCYIPVDPNYKALPTVPPLQQTSSPKIFDMTFQCAPWRENTPVDYRVSGTAGINKDGQTNSGVTLVVSVNGKVKDTIKNFGQVTNVGQGYEALSSGPDGKYEAKLLFNGRISDFRVIENTNCKSEKKATSPIEAPIPGQLCAAVLTHAKDSAGVCKIFPSSCLPEGWTVLPQGQNCPEQQAPAVPPSLSLSLQCLGSDPQNIVSWKASAAGIIPANSTLYITANQSTLKEVAGYANGEIAGTGPEGTYMVTLLDKDKRVLTLSTGETKYCPTTQKTNQTTDTIQPEKILSAPKTEEKTYVVAEVQPATQPAPASTPATCPDKSKGDTPPCDGKIDITNDYVQWLREYKGELKTTHADFNGKIDKTDKKQVGLDDFRIWKTNYLKEQ